jgi:DNA primase
MGVIAKTPAMRLDLDAIREAHPLPAVAGAVVKLRRAGAEWKACCPFHSDRSPSFTIYSGGQRFQCFGCGVQGDVLDFIQRLHGVGLVEAARMLGAGELPSVEITCVPGDSASMANDDRREEALTIWRSAVPVEGTAAETYLRWRGITIDPPMSLRYAELPYGRSGGDLPCLVCCVSSPGGPLSGIQRIFLAPDGRGKADVPKPKLSLGRVSGGAIRLGPLDGGELLVTEGPEDGLTLLQVLRRPVWVAAGGSMLPAMCFPDAVREVAIGGDNDDAGRAAAAKAARSFAERGLNCRVFFPTAGKDFNSELMEGASA